MVEELISVNANHVHQATIALRVKVPNQLQLDTGLHTEELHPLMVFTSAHQDFTVTQ